MNARPPTHQTTQTHTPEKRRRKRAHRGPVAVSLDPSGRGVVDVNLVLKVSEVFYFNMPADVGDGITEHR